MTSRVACWRTRWAMAKQLPPSACCQRNPAKYQMSGRADTSGRDSHGFVGNFGAFSWAASLVGFEWPQESGDIDLVSSSFGGAMGSFGWKWVLLEMRGPKIMFFYS